MHSTKQLLAIGTVLTLPIMVLASGPDMTLPKQPAKMGIYAEAQAGYAFRNWGNTALSPFSNDFTDLTSTSGTTGGLTYGGDLGFKLNKFLAVEGGWYSLPSSKGSGGGFGNLTTIAGEITSWLAYGAIRVSAPITKKILVFMKIGASYNDNQADGSGAIASQGTALATNSTYWSFIVGLGAKYKIFDNLDISFQALYVPGNNSVSSSSFTTPDTCLMTGGVGYTFNF